MTSYDNELCLFTNKFNMIPDSDASLPPWAPVLPPAWVGWDLACSWCVTWLQETPEDQTFPARQMFNPELVYRLFILSSRKYCNTKILFCVNHTSDAKKYYFMRRWLFKKWWCILCTRTNYNRKVDSTVIKMGILIIKRIFKIS